MHTDARRHKFLPSFLTLLGFFVSATAQVSPTQSQVAFENACKGLIGMALPGGSVASAQFIATGETAQPAHCRVGGKLYERTGIDNKPYAIGFEVRLPESWNQRFYFQGGGGTDGNLRPALGSMSAGGVAPNALSAGFVVASTDAGHLNESGPQGSFLFGVDPQARADYGYNHLPAVTAAAKVLIAKLHGRPPTHSYFVGCSNGGRQGMMATQRFPELFDGVISGAPAYRVVEASIDAAVQTQIFASVAPKDDQGKPVLGKALSLQELDATAKALLKSCDAQDGVTDGMINNPRACRFDPKLAACGGDATACISAEKATALQRAFAGVRNAQGKPLYATWPYDPGIATQGWTAWKLGPENASPPRALNTTLVAGALSHVFSTPPELTADLYGFVLNLDPIATYARTQQIVPPYKESGLRTVNADSPDLDAFVRRGGKILFYHGMADGIFSPHDTAAYVEKLRERYERKAEAFSRLYFVPGMGHCGGGPATDQFDALTPLIAWVEKGEAPTALIAKAGSSSPWPGRTRPLCPYPTQATYSGRGNIEDAANFTCK